MAYSMDDVRTAFSCIDWSKLPERYSGPLRQYLEYNVSPGGFLYNVLSNNLFRSVLLADKESRDDLLKIVTFIHVNLPLACHGAEEKVQEWLNKHVTASPTS